MDHDHHDHHGMDMSSTNSAPDAAATAAMDHGHHAMANGCKMSMLLNYNTINACFISENWKVSSTAVFAGSMIGVALLAILLELLRRGVKEFDKYLVRQHVCKHTQAAAPGSSDGDSGGKEAVVPAARAGVPPFRPNFWQQGIRAVLHTAQFTVAYFIMLLAMYYNVYVLVSIFLGILIGSYIFQYETMEFAQQGNSGGKGPTVCCG